MIVTPPTHCRRFRFSLRTLLLLVTLLCCFCGYVGRSMIWIRQREAFRNANAKPGWMKADQSGPAPWILRPFGERGTLLLFYNTAEESELLDASLLFPEAKIYCVRIIRNGIRYHVADDLTDSLFDEKAAYFQNGKLFQAERYVPIDAND